MIDKDIITELSAKLGLDLGQHIEEFACAFYEKVDCDPRKVVMIHHIDYATGKTYYYFEKKRGRSRKQILDNLKNK